MSQITKIQTPTRDLRSYYKNVYVGLDGCFYPLPFNGGEGLWYFDGQFFHKGLTKRKHTCYAACSSK